jgi:hypothetical protein
MGSFPMLMVTARPQSGHATFLVGIPSHSHIEARARSKLMLTTLHISVISRVAEISNALWPDQRKPPLTPALVSRPRGQLFFCAFCCKFPGLPPCTEIAQPSAVVALAAPPPSRSVRNLTEFALAMPDLSAYFSVLFSKASEES